MTIDLDALEKAAKRQQDGMVGPTSMVVGSETVIALVAAVKAAQMLTCFLDRVSSIDLGPGEERLNALRSALSQFTGSDHV